METKFYKFLLLLFLVIFTQCSVGINKTVDYTSEIENKILIEFQQLENKHKTIIADKSEKGESIVLCLTFLNKTDSTALTNQIVGFYNSSTSEILGMNKPTNEYAEKTNGLAITDEKGRIFVKTFIAKKNASIATEIFDAHPKSGTIKFKQHLTQRGIDFVLKHNDHFLADIKKTKDEHLVSFLTIEVMMPTSKIEQ